MYWLFVIVLLVASCASDRVKTLEVPVCEPNTNYTLPHFHYCDRYFSCVDGFVHEGQCADGFAYEPLAGCIYSHFVDCTSRQLFQTPIVIGACLHLNGIFEDPIRGCDHFYECIDGVANSHTCVEGLVFDSNLRKCRQTTVEESAQCFALAINPLMTPPLVDFAVAPSPEFFEEIENAEVDADGIKFRCPEDALYTFGDHARYPYPGKCRFYIICWKDGKAPTVNGCPENTAYDPMSFTCENDAIFYRCPAIQF